MGFYLRNSCWYYAYLCIKKTALHFFKAYTGAFFLSVMFCSAQIVQEDFAEDEAFVYKSDISAGVLFSTNGGIPAGFRAKYAWQHAKKSKQFHQLSLDIVNIRHPKEYRLASDSGSGYFIYNKTNFLFVVRANYGRELLLFRKSSEEGTELKLVASAGPSIGLVKPYYVLASNGRGLSTPIHYEPGVRIDRILGNSFFTGFDEISAVLGANARISLEFGISAWDIFVTGVEMGFQAEALTKKVPIIAFADNKSVFTSAFVNFYFGKRY
ncbi:MAG TPA: hypothetical protein DCR46_05350 [Cytophagales bacterium]|nr:hypothetical protein [Cytophagales bacterium]